MSVRNSFAFLDDSEDDEPIQQVKVKAKPKAKAPAAPAPARNNNRGSRRDDNNRRDNRGGHRRGEYNRDVGESNSRKYRRDDRRTDRRRDADRRDNRRAREGNSQDRRGRNQYEKTHQKRGPKKGGHGGWGTDKDAVDVVEEEATATADTPTEEAEEETPSEPAAPAVVELTLEEHEAAEKERRAKFNSRWGSNTAAASSADLEKEFSGMAVVGKKSRNLGAGKVTASKKPYKTASKSAQKAKELKKAIFAEPTHYGSSDDRDYSRGRGGRGRGRGGGRGGRNRGGGRDGRDNRRRGYTGNVDTQDVNEFPALA